jgi:iron complex outermembrane recepter protein
MKQFFTLTIIVTLFNLQSNAQENTGRITGLVTDMSRKQVEAATVALLRSNDTLPVKSTLTDQQGVYRFEAVPAGNYLVSVSSVGFSNTVINNIRITPQQLFEVKPVVMESKAKDLAAVTVVAGKPLIENRIDRTVVNVDAAVTNAGASALEVLEKSPGITVDKDGNISLKGKQGVMVMIDNKPSYLSGAELVNLLRNMNANQLDQIEIMTNPPAKYDAAGNSGIINIKTKKNKLKGFNGSLSTGFGQGSYWKTNNSLNMNYRNGKFNSFLNLSYNKNYSYTQLDILRKYKSGEGKTVTAIFEQRAFMKNMRESSNAKAGIDYFLNSKTTLGVVATGFLSPEDFRATNTSYLKNAAAVVDSIVTSESHNKNTWKNGTLNFNFRHQFDSSGRELTADLDYATYSSNNRQDLVNISYQPDLTRKNMSSLIGVLPVDINIYSAKADYTQNIGSVKFEAGVKTSFVNTNNIADYRNLISGSWQPDYDKTNGFTYEENINAAYLNFNKQFKKLGVQAGLRYENTNYTGHQSGNTIKPDSVFSSHYDSWFPTVYLSYELNKKHRLGFNAGRRIDRPAYQDLNPFLFFIDNYTYQAGNPYLKPQYSNNLEFSHTYNNFLTTTVNYSQTNNLMTETFHQQDYATIVREGNIGRRNNAGIAVSAQVPVQKWWMAVLYTNYNYTSYSGLLNGEQLNLEASNVLVNVNNQFKFSKGWSAELSGFYRSKGVEGQILIDPMGQVSAGVARQVLNNKGSIRFNIRDMFYTQKVTGYINFQQTEASFRNIRDSRVANVTFTYRFGKPLKDVSQRKRGGAADEENRVKIGGN